jgi:hypothetical protein
MVTSVFAHPHMGSRRPDVARLRLRLVHPRGPTPPNRVACSWGPLASPPTSSHMKHPIYFLENQDTTLATTEKKTDETLETCV